MSDELPLFPEITAGENYARLQASTRAREGWAAAQREELARRAAMPLRTGLGDVTADAFGGGDTPLFNCGWKGAGQ